MHLLTSLGGLHLEGLIHFRYFMVFNNIIILLFHYVYTISSLPHHVSVLTVSSMSCRGQQQDVQQYILSINNKVQCEQS